MVLTKNDTVEKNRRLPRLTARNDSEEKNDSGKPPRPSDTPPQEWNLKTAGMPTVPIYGGVAFASNDGVVKQSKWKY